MDPNEALRKLRELAACLLADDGLTRPQIDDGIELAELFTGLDEWLSTPKAGFLPAAWTHNVDLSSYDLEGLLSLNARINDAIRERGNA